MPRGDRTGPMGSGPMTGRGLGYCAGNPVPGFMSPLPGRGFWGWGRGRGRGRGWRNWFYATGLTGRQRAAMTWPTFDSIGSNVMPGGVPFTPGTTSKQELDALKGQEEYLGDALEGVKKRIAELESRIDSETG